MCCGEHEMVRINFLRLSKATPDTTSMKKKCFLAFRIRIRELMPTIRMSVSDHRVEYFAAAASLLKWIFVEIY